MAFTYDPASGLPDLVKGNRDTVTGSGWAEDRTLTSRADQTFGTTSFGYDWLAKRLTDLTPPRRHGLRGVARGDDPEQAQRRPNAETATLTYDTARRPTAINLTGSRSLTRTYDRVGNVTSGAFSASRSRDTLPREPSEDRDCHGRIRVVSGLRLEAGEPSTGHPVDGHADEPAVVATP